MLRVVGEKSLFAALGLRNVGLRASKQWGKKDATDMLLLIAEPGSCVWSVCVEMDWNGLARVLL